MAEADAHFEDIYVHTDRLERTQQEMTRHGIDLLLVGPSSDLFYLIGVHAHLSERLNLLILPREGNPSYVVPTLEAPLLAKRRDLIEIQAWDETEQPRRRRGAPDRRCLRQDSRGRRPALERLPGAAAGCYARRPLDRGRTAPATAADDQGRPRDRAAARRRPGERTKPGTSSSAHPLAGLTERQAIARLMELTTKRGLAPGFGSCCSGPNAASPHHHTGDRVIQSGRRGRLRLGRHPGRLLLRRDADGPCRRAERRVSPGLRCRPARQPGGAGRGPPRRALRGRRPGRPRL